MALIPTLIEMLESGVHFGHRTSRWHPKMEKFIFGARTGFHVIDLEETQKQLEKAANFVKQAVSRGGNVLFVGTKEQTKKFVEKYATECNMPYVTERWLGGTLTNYSQIKQSLKRLKMLKDQRDKGELRKYTKKERLMIDREIVEMQHKLGGIEDMERVPNVVFILDIRMDKTALKEARHVGAKIVAVCDTNVNPDGVDYVIPANDDAVKSIEMMCRVISDSVKAGNVEAQKSRLAKKDEIAQKNKQSQTNK